MIERAVLIAVIFLTFIFGVLWLERKWPIGPNLPHPEVKSDWVAVLINLTLSSIVKPLALIPSVAIIGWLGGGGLVHVRTDGWWYIPSLIGFILLVDLYHYGVHRIQHAVPMFWAMHSFHHSANSLTFITGARHFWLEWAMPYAIFPIIPIFFTISADMATIIAVVFFIPDSCAHLNVRFPMGPAITWVNSPQWHRIHHSVQPEHFNKNFASLLPLWDFVFGTAWIPKPDEYPAPGLVPAEPVGAIDSIVWPFRAFIRDRLAAFRGAGDHISRPSGLEPPVLNTE